MAILDTSITPGSDPTLPPESGSTTTGSVNTANPSGDLTNNTLPQDVDILRRIYFNDESNLFASLRERQIGFDIDASDKATLVLKDTSGDPHYFQERTDADLRIATIEWIGASTHEATGFEDSSETGVQVTGDGTTRKVTLTHPSGTIDMYENNKYIPLASPYLVDVAHGTDTAQSYFLQYSNGVFAWGSGFDFRKVQVAIASYIEGEWRYFQETHGHNMDWRSHEENHQIVGTYYVPGTIPTLTAGTFEIQPASPTDAHNTFGVDAGVVKDEDNLVTVPAWVQGSYFLAYLTPTGLDFTVGATNPLRSAPGGFVYYQDSSGNDVEASNKAYLNAYLYQLPMALDANSQDIRTLVLQPQAEYTTAEEALAENHLQLNKAQLEPFFAEFAVCQKVTIQVQASYGTLGKYRIHAVTEIDATREGGQSTSTGTTVHNLLTGRDALATHPATSLTFAPAGDLSSTTVQTAIEELDSEKVPNTRTITAGSGLTGGGDLSANRTISHDDTSSVGNINTSGAQVIDTLTFDGFGHTTAFALRSITASDVGALTQSDGDLRYLKLDAGNDPIVGDLHFSGSRTIASNTSDGSDNKRMNFSGSGGVGSSRGGYVSAFGNEHPDRPGQVILVPGDGAQVRTIGDHRTEGGVFIDSGGNSTEWNTAYDHSQIVTGNPHQISFADLTSTPTTISGYGITDAYTKTQADGRYLQTETDTLATVTGRGSTTSNSIQVGSIGAGGAPVSGFAGYFYGGSNLFTANFEHTGTTGGISVQSNKTISTNDDAQLRLIVGTTRFGVSDQAYQVQAFASSPSQVDYRIDHWNGTAFANRMTIYGDNGSYTFPGNGGFGGAPVSGFAGYFYGDVRATGNLTVDGEIITDTQNITVATASPNSFSSVTGYTPKSVLSPDGMVSLSGAIAGSFSSEFSGGTYRYVGTITSSHRPSRRHCFLSIGTTGSTSIYQVLKGSPPSPSTMYLSVETDGKIRFSAIADISNVGLDSIAYNKDVS